VNDNSSHTVHLIDSDFISQRGITKILEDYFRKTCIVHSNPDQLSVNKNNFIVLNASNIVEDERTCLLTITNKYNRALIILEPTNTSLINLAWKNNVSVIISRNINQSEWLIAFNALFNNKKYISPDILESGFLNQQLNQENILTSREKEILGLIAKGLSSQKIADHLFVSIHTVNSHRKNIIKKTGIQSPAALVMYALENGY